MTMATSVATVSGTITEEDYSAAAHLAAETAGVRLGTLITALVVAIFLLLDQYRYWFLGAVAFVLVVLVLSVPRRLRTEYRQFKAIAEPVSICANDDGLLLERENGRTHLPWHHIIRLRANRKCLLIYPSARIYHIVPAHFFPSNEEYEHFVTLVQARSGVSSNHLDKRTAGRGYRVS